MEVEGDVFVGVELLGVGHDALHGQRFHRVHVFDFLDEVLVADLLRVAAASVPPAEQVGQFFVAHQSEVVEYAHELLAGDQVAVGAVVVLQGRFDEDAFAGDGPADVVQHLLNSGSCVADPSVFPQLAEVGFGEFGVAELFVDVADELRVLGQISGFHSVLVDEGLDLIGVEVEVEEAEGGGEGRDELVLDAVALPEFVVVFEESFDSDLFLPDLCADACLDALDGGGAVGAVDCIGGCLRELVAACLKMEVISYILLLLVKLIS